MEHLSVDNFNLTFESNLLSKVDQYFPYDSDSFKNNQTICLAYSPVKDSWSDDECQSSIDLLSMAVHCECDIELGKTYSVMTDSSRKPDKVQQSTTVTPSTLNSQAILQANLSIISVLIFLGLMSVFVPVYAFTQDKKDLAFAEAQIASKKNSKLIEILAGEDIDSARKWQYKVDEIPAYSMESKSLFSYLFTQTHSWMSIFVHFDAEVSRARRFGFQFLQLCSFALLCLLTFGENYRQQDQVKIHDGLDEADINRILIIGAIGMLILLPVPMQSACLRVKDSKKSLRMDSEHD